MRDLTRRHRISRPQGGLTRAGDAPERQAEPAALIKQARGAGVYAVDAMVEMTRSAAEDEHVARLEDEALVGIAAPRPTEVKGGVVAQRDRDDGGAGVVLILVAVRAELRPRRIVIHQARLGRRAVACHR